MERPRNERARKQEIPEKNLRPTASSGTIPTCENPVTRPVIQPGSPWRKANNQLKGEAVAHLTISLVASSGTIPTGENPGAAPPGIEPGLPLLGGEAL
ncbi:hypothetical protein PR048_028231 [Dryococelus australis]|uniref:Uncharacterized protein n=1 Tax=Dryococelus australis TaxID=614101 RepID=A0ABQ9GIP8_9NEOP|nr:hypothetical protein PR048_028231 [Dryococelus australis]